MESLISPFFYFTIYIFQKMIYNKYIIKNKGVLDYGNDDDKRTEITVL